MTETVLTTDQLDSYVRERVETILVTPRNNSSRNLHLQSEDGWMDTVCKSTTTHGWLDKPLSVYPPQYHPICPSCVEERFGVEVLRDE